MAKVLHMQHGAGISIAASATRYQHLGCNNRFNDDETTEANAQITYRSGGVFSNLSINILTNDRGTSTYRTRKNAGNGSMVVSITGTGEFEDTVNTDAVTAGEEWNYSMVTGAGGTVFTYRIASVIFNATTNSVSRLVSEFSATNINTASSTLVGPLAGDGITTETTDSNNGIIYRTAGTLSNLFARVSANARTTTSTIRSRINSANGNLTFSVTAGATGFFEDTSNSDSVAIGDLVNCAIVTGTGTENMTMRSVAADFTTTNNQFMYSAASNGAQTVLVGVTTYYPFAGALRTSTTEADMQAEPNLIFTGSLAQANITANTVVESSTVRLRINGGNGNQVVSLTGLTTGVFQDTSNVDSIVADDLINYSLVTGATGTSLVIRSISMVGSNLTVSVSPLTMTLGLVVGIPSVKNLPNAQTISASLPTPTVQLVSTSLNVNVPCLTITASLVSPTAKVSVNPNAQTIIALLVSATPAIRNLATALSAALSLQTSTRVVAVSPLAQTANFTQPSPTISGSSTKNVNVSCLTMSIQVVALNPSIKILPNAQSINASLQGPTKQVSPTISNAQLLSMVLNSPVTKVAPGVSSLQAFFAMPGVTITGAGGSTSVFVDALTMRATLCSPTISHIYRQLTRATKHNQPKYVNKINAVRRISRKNASVHTTKHQL